jgi:hypothetical protein
VADGAALAAPGVREAIDAARAHVPASLGCVVDAAVASDAVAVAEDPAGIAIVVVGAVPACAALVASGPDVAIAKIGAPALPADGAATAVDDPRWARARTYLAHAPIVAALDLGEHHVVAALQAEPLALWVTIDSAERAPDLGGFLAQLKDTPLAGKLETTSVEHQIVVRATNLTAGELATLARATIDALAAPPPFVRDAFHCPSNGGATPCTGSKLTVASVAATLRDLQSRAREPAVYAGDVIGMRIDQDIGAIGIRRGDIVLGVDERQLDTQLAFPDTLRHARLAIRRGTTDFVVDLQQE